MFLKTLVLLTHHTTLCIAPFSLLIGCALTCLLKLTSTPLLVSSLIPFILFAKHCFYASGLHRHSYLLLQRVLCNLTQLSTNDLLWGDKLMLSLGIATHSLATTPLSTSLIPSNYSFAHVISSMLKHFSKSFNISSTIFFS